MIETFSVPHEDTLGFGPGLTTVISERMNILRFWPGVKTVEFHTEGGKGVLVIDASSRALLGIRRACIFCKMHPRDLSKMGSMKR